MKKLDVNLINLFSSYHVWEESNRFFFETDYELKYFVDFTLDDSQPRNHPQAEEVLAFFDEEVAMFNSMKP